jgi:diguanylate cyclase (GGDEF)-like protein/PAS domain S-box-containing protein
MVSAAFGAKLRDLTGEARAANQEQDAAVHEQLEILRAHVSDAVVTLDADGRVLHANAAAERLLADAPPGELGEGFTTIPLSGGGAVAIASATAPTFPAFGSLDLDETAQRAAEAFVPALADICLVHTLEQGGEAVLRGTAAAAPAVADALAELRGSESPLTDAIKRVLASDGADAVLQGRLDAPGMLHSARTPLALLVIDALGASCWRTTLPLRGREGVRGLVTLLSADAPPHLACAREFAERVGQAIENARLYEIAVAARARFTAAFENAPLGIALVRTDAERPGIVTAANPALCEITGRDDLVGAAIVDLHHPDDRPAAQEGAAWLVEGDAGERRFQRPDGRTVWVHIRTARLEGEPVPHVVLQVQDVTERKQYEARLQYLADHDPLTGLYNRRRFAEELDWIVAYSRRYGTPAAVVVLDLDNFKFVNDTYGHATGDELLATVGGVLRARCRESDIAGRLGGDEFGVILPQASGEEADLVAQSLLEAVRSQVQVTVGARTLRATASIGVRLVGPETKLSAEDLLSDADIALYDAKEAGRDRISVSADDRGLTDRLRARINWSERIRDALEEDRFVLYEQPIVRIATGAVEGSELLLRMLGQDGDTVAPGEFLDVAERFGQIQAIDRWVIARAVRLLAERQAAGIALNLEVNLSGGSITDPTVIDFIVSEVRNAPIDPTRLTFEITETAAIVSVDRARSLAQSLANLGCRFALDDFGSGFGSFYYLKHLPCDIVKIDGEFVRGLVESRTDRLTVGAIVQIASALGKPTIAERVEDDATLRLLNDIGVDYAQGYLLGRPRPVRVDPGLAP